MKKYFGIYLLILFVVNCESNEVNYEEILERRFLSLIETQKQNGIAENMVKNAPSLNFNLRNPTYIIIHHTEQTSCEQTIDKFSKPVSMVSAHYLICKDGDIFQTADDFTRAWHSGLGQWGSIKDMNSVSLGIELDNIGYESFSDDQIESLIILLKHLQGKYKISPTNILGHGDIAPGRKEDPHCLFPWQELADEGLAVMPDETYIDNKKVPDYFDPLMALRLIGYDVSNPVETIRAFRRRFIGCDGPDAEYLTDEELRILENLSSKYFTSATSEK